jgi:hypothetical protein
MGGYLIFIITTHSCFQKKFRIKEPLVLAFPKPQRAARFHGRTSSSLGGSLTFSILSEW